MASIKGMAVIIYRLCLVGLTFISMASSSRKVGESKLPLHQEQDALSTHFLAIEHSFDQGATPEFSSRGVLSFRSNKQGYGMFTQHAPLTAGEKRKLKDLAQRGGIYRVRVPTLLEENAESSSKEFVSTFTKACAILESRLSEEITINVDQSGNVLGVSIVPLKGSCDHESAIESASLDYFNTTVSLSVTVAGPAPETQVYIQKMEEERLQKEKGKGQDNRSFFSKYWMYIVPVVLFVLLSSGGEQQRG
ncbi:ER membrane protein complex subunit 10-like [Diadema antillarum]|uniref:ER membrane protein complex subunit 10-like n=1 Tax=Diadema antillarum TaxID=105358 RepID=UPI003A83C5C2